MKQENFVLIISSPSGAGKTSIVKKIASSDCNFLTSVSVTTREKRFSENNGKDYFFVNKEVFKEMLNQDQFLEYTEIFDNYYASPKNFVETKLAEGFDILFDVDWCGAENIKQKLGNSAISIFILPPSLEELEKRLQNRQENSKEEISKRLKNAPFEISKYISYDYVLINENFDETLSNIFSIIKAERIKRCNYKNFITTLV